MHFFNHYSVPVIAAILLAAGLAVLTRCGGTTRGGLILAGALVVYAAAWATLRPVPTPGSAAPGQPVLLEVQSPYCLGCVAMKPVVDRLEHELRGRLAVRRVDIQSAEGQRLVAQYRIEFTPTFIFFDAAGREQWRSVGRLDGARVRAMSQ